MATILIVDDASIIREPIAASLRLAGHQTICASNGQEALWIMQSRRPDLVLLDLAMPGLDGTATLKQIRANPALATLPVIVLTAAQEQRFTEALAPLRPDECLYKSHFSLPQLTARIEHHLARHRGAA